MTPHTKRKILLFWRRQIRPILVLVLCFTAFRSSFADWNDVPTGSMKPTIFEGDRIYVNKVAYGLKFPYTTWHLARWGAPGRGEIVVFYSPRNGTRLVKRVVGLPGERIMMRGGQLYINGKPLEMTPFTPTPADLEQIPRDQHQTTNFFREHGAEPPYVTSLLSDKGLDLRRDAYGRPVYPMRDFSEREIPAGHYFMMGDNRDNSDDSRYIGTVPVDQILGRSSRVIFSLDYKNWWLPRGNRWFHAMK